MSNYTPPKDAALNLTGLKKIEETEKLPDFEFDPSRTDKEVAAIKIKEITDAPQTGLIRFWSHSSLQQFGNCPYSLWLKRIQKIKEEPGPPLIRGNLLHDQAEQYVNGTRDVLPEAKEIAAFAARFDALRYEYKQGNVLLEQDWGFNKDWDVIKTADKIYKHPDLWAVTKLDVFLWESETSAQIIDHKSGKKFGNEMKHGAQGMEYAVSAFMRFPQLEYVKSDFWYIDQGQDMARNYTRAEAMRLLPRITERAVKMTTATKFPPKPSRSNCKWCFFAKEKHCEYAYEDL